MKPALHSLILSLALVVATAACSGSGTDTTASSSASTGGTGGTGGSTSDGAGGTGGTGGSGGTSQGGGGSVGCDDAADCDDGIGCTSDSCDDGTCVNTPTNASCDDSLYCNGSETCDPQNGDPTTGCVAGTDPCDDGVACTLGSCDETADSCSQTNDDTVCDDAAYCNGAETCDPQNGDPTTGCLAGADPCDDGIGCTVDSCDETADSCSQTNDNTFCDDAAYCNGAETCDPQNGDPTTGCLAGSDPCDDGVGCTVASCDEVNDACSQAPDNTVCDDTLFCNGVEACDPANSQLSSGCVSGTDPCNDSVGCTIDSCDDVTDTCGNLPNNAACDDAVFCNGAEVCDAINDCMPGTPPVCDDGVSCTTDFCNVNTDACSNVAVNANCSDGLFCTGLETCDPANGAPGTGCVAGTAIICDDQIPCTVDSCDESADACDFSPDHTVCDDGLVCNGDETCQLGTGCQPGSAILCDDGLSCTSDSCTEPLGCTFTENDAACDDGLFCNGDEFCDANQIGPGSGCLAGMPFMCQPDAHMCTDEICNEQSMACDSVANDNNCMMGELCKPSLGGCVQADPCLTTADCAVAEDGNLCNGTLICNTSLNICEVDPGTIVNCNDGLSCTIDSCAPSTGVCSNTPNHAACDDGFMCNGAEICDPFNGDPNTGCADGIAVDCDDSVPCTFDQCNEPSGSCANTPINALCSDGLFCTGIETCDPVQGCVAGPAPTCSDQVACTTDICDLMFDTCLSIPDDDACPCNQTCDAQNGCGNFCQVTECQGKVYECGDCIDNDNDCHTDVGSDPECFGPCDNNEEGYKGNIPGQNSAPCKQDCYFDGDTGAGNDDCYWSHKCDPYEVPPNYSPEGSACAYDPNANVPGSSQSCSQLEVAQSQMCTDYCGPLTPNGCDCFGCCEVPSLPYAVWLGSTDQNGDGSCTTANLNDPNACKPCTIVQGCFNTCDNCELCFGKPQLPPECLCQECPPGAQLCGGPCGSQCPILHFCSNGCCVPEPG